MEQKIERKNHRWSGWPGAFCLDCFCDDPWELALADNLYDPYTEKWKDCPESEELKRRIEEPCLGRRVPVVE